MKALFKLPFQLLTILVTAEALLHMAFINGYPIVTSNTDTYLHSGFMNQVPPDRPVIYGLFVRHISLAESFWIVVALKAMTLFWFAWYAFWPDAKVYRHNN